MIIDDESGNRLVGTYRGIVLKHLPHGRCKVFIPGVYDPVFMENPDLLPSAQPKTPLFAGTNNGNGVFSYPNIGSFVWCSFMNDDANYPVFEAATLGGENAFGQYDLIKGADEPVSDRHMITSGKTHMIWYEKGKLSGIVEDPIRTECRVTYDQYEMEDDNTSVENKYSYQISNDVLSRIAAGTLSNINCQYVLDNNGGAHGVLSTSTHWYDIISSDISDTSNVKSGIVSTDNWNVMNNNGAIDIGTLSTQYVQAKLKDEKTGSSSSTTKMNIVNDYIKMKVPGIRRDNVGLSSYVNYANDNGDVIREVIASTTSSLYDTSSNVAIGSIIAKDIYKSTSELTDIQKLKLSNLFSMESPGDIDLCAKIDNNHAYNVKLKQGDKTVNAAMYKHLKSTGRMHLDTDANAKLKIVKDLQQFSGNAIVDTELTNQYEMTEDGEISILTKINDVSLRDGSSEKTKAYSYTVQDVTGKHSSKASYKNIKQQDSSTVIDNATRMSMENKPHATMQLKAVGKTLAGDSKIIDAEYSNVIDTSTSTADIKIIDNIVQKECVSNMNAKVGLTEIRITNKSSGMHCVIKMDAEGTMTIDTTNQLVVKTTNNVSIGTQTASLDATKSATVTSPTVTVNGDTTINGTLHVTGMTTIDADASIGNISFLGHSHIETYHGTVTTPPI